MAWLGAVLAVVLIVVVFIDTFEAMILPRRVRHGYRLARLFYRSAWLLCRGLARLLPAGRWRQGEWQLFVVIRTGKVHRRRSRFFFNRLRPIRGVEIPLEGGVAAKAVPTGGGGVTIDIRMQWANVTAHRLDGDAVELIGEVHGPAAALALIDELDLAQYFPFHAARADLLRRLGRTSEAAAAYERAAAMAPSEAERNFLTQAGRPSVAHHVFENDDSSRVTPISPAANTGAGAATA